MLTHLAFIVLAYLLGSISSAVIVCKLFDLPDPRSTGSNNPGATNVLRIGGKSKAIMVLVFDMLKGILPILAARYQGLSFFWMGLTGLAAVIGHIFPVFYQWKGGKGVATAFGVYFALSGWIGLFCAIVWGIVFKLFRYSSLASLITAISAPCFSLFLLLGTGVWIPLGLIGFLIIFKHHQNIDRLLQGKEPKFSKSKQNT